MCIRDRLRIVQQAMTCFLNEVAGILEEGGYQYWLDFGTLLGAVRLLSLIHISGL